MKNFKQTPKQKRVLMVKAKTAFVNSRKQIKPVQPEVFDARLGGKRWQVGCYTNMRVDWGLSLSHSLGIYA